MYVLCVFSVARLAFFIGVFWEGGEIKTHNNLATLFTNVILFNSILNVILNIAELQYLAHNVLEKNDFN